MKYFSHLLNDLVLSPARNRKLELLTQYLRTVPDPDRGYALAALTGNLDFPHVKSSAFRDLVLARIDPYLFSLSYDYVGDLADTISLIWPAQKTSGGHLPTVTEVVETLRATPKDKVGAVLSEWLDAGDDVERWGLIKLVTGSLRIGLSERLAKQALANLSGTVSTEEIEEVWHGLAPPYPELFAWACGHGPRPDPGELLTFRSLMLAHPSEDVEKSIFAPDVFAAEWKWDGIRVQLVGNGESCRLFSRTGEDITAGFPDLLGSQCVDGVLDGELLVLHEGKVAPFNDLQQRLNRKSPGQKLMAQHPAHLRLYDILFDGKEDLRALSFRDRRKRLERWFAQHQPPRMDISPLLEFQSHEDLGKIQSGVRHSEIGAEVEGFMLKRWDAPYIAGRPKGYWFKWKRDPLSSDLVLMYAQRGHGKRSSFYSDYTFGAWTEDDSGHRFLIPVGKAYSGYTDEELAKLDRWIRNHTKERFGPVRVVEPGIVMELGFDSIHRSGRHKSGVAMRFPRILRIRWDKPANEADELKTLQALIR